MRLVVLLVVGVVPPPLPYLPPPLLLLLLVGVVAVDPELPVLLALLLPQAAKRMTSAAAIRTLHQARHKPFEMKRLRCIMIYFPHF
jgi:hypothetical protein